MPQDRENRTWHGWLEIGGPASASFRVVERDVAPIRIGIVRYDGHHFKGLGDHEVDD